MPRFIPVSKPALVGNERRYVDDCLDSSWISSIGPYISRFEDAFAAYCGVEHAMACSNGTVALHLALLALGIGAGDEVIVPTLTYVATANAVTYCGARPVFADSEPDGWGLDAQKVEALISTRTRAIIAVHLYGHPANMDAIGAVARKHKLAVIEDAAEAHGSEYHGKRAGTLGDVATFSFYGNKIITCGEGGMVVTQSPALARTIRQLKGQGVDPERRYWFPVVGYNYRMTNIAAAIGLAQLERVEWHVQRRAEVGCQYRAELAGEAGLWWQRAAAHVKPVDWLVTVALTSGDAARRDAVCARMADEGIETRPVFYPVHSLPPYAAANAGTMHPVAEEVAARGLSLPTWAGLSREDVSFICGALKRSLRETEA